MSNIEIREVFDDELGFPREIRFVVNPAPIDELTVPSLGDGTVDIEDLEEYFLTKIDYIRQEKGYGPEDEFNHDVRDFNEIDNTNPAYEFLLDMMDRAAKNYKTGSLILAQEGSTEEIGGGQMDEVDAELVSEFLEALETRIQELVNENDHLFSELLLMYYALGIARENIMEDEIPDFVKYCVGLAHTVCMEVLDTFFLSVGFDHKRVLSYQLYEVLSSLNPAHQA